MSPYEKKESSRPFRIWNAKTKKHCVGRQYRYMTNALDGALLMVRWGDTGMALEVYNAETGKLIGQYVRKPTSIWFKGM